MKKTTPKIIFCISSLSLLLLYPSQQAKAWKLFGKEITHEVAINELECEEGCVGIYREYDKYFLGIKIGSGFEKDCICP